jgi:hypothetical protein
MSGSDNAWIADHQHSLPSKRSRDRSKLVQLAGTKDNSRGTQEVKGMHGRVQDVGLRFQLLAVSGLHRVGVIAVTGAPATMVRRRPLDRLRRDPSVV